MCGYRSRFCKEHQYLSQRDKRNIVHRRQHGLGLEQTGMLDGKQPCVPQPYTSLCKAHVRHGRYLHSRFATSLIHRGECSTRHLLSRICPRPEPLVLSLYGRGFFLHNGKKQLDTCGKIPEERKRSGQHLGKQRSGCCRQHKEQCRYKIIKYGVSKLNICCFLIPLIKNI